MKPQEASHIERIPAGAAMKASILLVDDRPANLLALEAILDSLDQRLVRASSGEEALEKLDGEEFAVILMDVRMPGMDGLRTAEVISQRERAARVPIIFLTAVPIGNADVASGYARGAVDFLLKPFDPEILRSKVSVFVDLYQKEQMIRRQAGLLRQRDREAFERRSELRFRSLMDALPQCVWVARSDLTFYYWNKRAVDYIGLPASMAVSADRLFEFVHPDDLAAISSEWQLATSVQRSAEVQVRLRRHADGAYRWFLMRGVPQHDEAGKVTGWIVAATDIDTEHQALEEAEDASRMKEEFLATVSHELRNPLNAIVGWVHLLRSGNLDLAKSSKALETIERNVHLQTALIDDILDVSRIIRGKINLTFRTVRMVAVVDAALASVRPTADAKGVALEYEMAADRDEISGDADRLEPARERDQIHAARWPGHGSHGTARRRADVDGARYRPGNLCRFHPARVRPVQPGRQRQHSRAWRPRPRTCDRASFGRTPCRHSGSDERRSGSGRHLLGPHPDSKHQGSDGGQRSRSDRSAAAEARRRFDIGRR